MIDRLAHNHWRRFGWLVCALLLAVVACSDDDSPGTDSAPPPTDSSTTDSTDMGKLWECTEPGKACNAHNACAINPVCGQDKLCRPASMQNCSDKLSCTVDTCKGLGLCENKPETGSCALPVSTGGTADGGVADGGTADGGAADAGADGGGQDAAIGTFATEVRCFKQGDKHPKDPCQICDTKVDAKKWSPATGGNCDDGNACTKDDYCQTGLCKGTDYSASCSDGYSCTTDGCDGKGACLGNVLKSGWCLISGACYQKGAKHPQGSCFECDPAKSTSAWSAIGQFCFINSKCYKAGDKSANGCGECKPSASTTAFTPLSNLCQINSKCYKDGAQSSTLTCGLCKASVSQTAWTPATNTCLIANKCYKPGDKSKNGCSECKPSASQSAWTALSQMCLIDAKCYKDGAVHTEKCAKCDAKASASAWTVTDAKYCIVKGSCAAKATSTAACGACGVACNPGETCAGGKCTCGTLSGTVGGGPACGKGKYCVQKKCTNLPPGTLLAPLSLDFEKDNGGLTGTKDWEWGKLGAWKPTKNCDSTSSMKQPTKAKSGLGTWGTKISDCYSPLGNASATCSNAKTTDDSVLTLKVKLPGNWTSATLTFYQWYDLFLTFDWSEIRVDGKVAAQTCKGSTPSPPGWTKRTVDLSSYTGKIATVTFHMMATSVVNYSGWYIDDLAISGK